jgi:hypothetical protein
MSELKYDFKDLIRKHSSWWIPLIAAALIGGWWMGKRLPPRIAVLATIDFPMEGRIDGGGKPEVVPAITEAVFADLIGPYRSKDSALAFYRERSPTVRALWFDNLYRPRALLVVEASTSELAEARAKEIYQDIHKRYDGYFRNKLRVSHVELARLQDESAVLRELSQSVAGDTGKNRLREVFNKYLLKRELFRRRKDIEIKRLVAAPEANSNFNLVSIRPYAQQNLSMTPLQCMIFAGTGAVLLALALTLLFDRALTQKLVFKLTEA